MKHIIHMAGGATEFFTVASVPGPTPDRTEDQILSFEVG